jgi:hypothetical protein
MIKFLLIIILCQSFLLLDLKKNIIGEWEYRYSLFNNSKIVIKPENHCPVQRMTFRKCIDMKELKALPKIIKVQRKGNLLENISCETYNRDRRIDKYFPIANREMSNKDTIYNVLNYGYRYKSEYNIEILVKDTIVIFDDKNYYIGGKKYTAIRHVYTRK